MFNKFLKATTYLNIVLALAAMIMVGPPAARADGDSSGVLVRTKQGTTRGKTVGNVEQFLGLPYATPPIGELRWKAPVAPKMYAGTLEATTFPAPCMQNQAPAGLPALSEDCLYLNIYRPVGSKEGKKMPVLLYIHGGGFAGGSGSARDGSPLAGSNDMIVIMINYRLGALGWLGLPALDAETPNGSSSGNYGLLDMVAALRWVRDNVAAFGGDKDNVTVAGTSAGGIAVCSMMTAGLNEKLFQKAIIESGECTGTSAFIISHQAALLQGANFAAKMGCTDSKMFAACLRSKPAQALVAAMQGLGNFTANVGGAVMPVAPLKAIQAGALERIPVIVGSTHDEQRRNPVATTGFPATQQTFEKYLTTTFGPLAPLVEEEYKPSGFTDPAYAAGAAASDSGIPQGIGVCPMLVELGTALSKVTKTYAYELNDPRGSGAPDAAGFEPGSLHTAEVGVLYGQAAPGSRTPEQEQMAARMQRYWATFARSGRPTDGVREWPALQNGSGRFLRFQPKGDVMVSSTVMPNEHHCDFWAGLGY